MRLLQQGHIHLLGSDCYNLTSRKPNLREALDCIRSQLDEEALAEIRSYERTVFDR